MKKMKRQQEEKKRSEEGIEGNTRGRERGKIWEKVEII